MWFELSLCADGLAVERDAVERPQQAQLERLNHSEESEKWEKDAMRKELEECRMRIKRAEGELAAMRHAAQQGGKGGEEAEVQASICKLW